MFKGFGAAQAVTMLEALFFLSIRICPESIGAYPGLTTDINFSCQPGFERLKKIKKRKNVRAHTQLAIFGGLASEMSPAKIVTSLLTLPSVLGADHFI